ncbi:MAG: adenosylmethionine decarboxylase [Candidatus Eremiobacterota bacterium]
MKALGSHVIAELSHCQPDVLANLERVQEAMIRAAKEARATVREVAFHKFYPHGVSGVVVLSESHIAIHTWPEFGYAAIDVYTCGGHTDPWRACEFLAGVFGSKTMSTTVVERGVPTPFGTYNHVVSASRHDTGRLVSNAS